MRQVVANTFVTVDGVMQAPGGTDEDTAGGFTHGGWSVNYWDDVMGEQMGAFMSEPFDLLLGRVTYQIFAAHWPNVTDDPAADVLNTATKYVASRTLEAVDWANSVLLRGDVVEEVRKLKDQDGPEIQVHGSGDLLQTLTQHDLVNVYRIWTFPLVLGTGKRLFESGTAPRGLRLADSVTSTTGVVIATYEPAGAIDYGSFEIDRPTETVTKTMASIGREIERRR